MREIRKSFLTMREIRNMREIVISPYFFVLSSNDYHIFCDPKTHNSSHCHNNKTTMTPSSPLDFNNQTTINILPIHTHKTPTHRTSIDNSLELTDELLGENNIPLILGTQDWIPLAVSHWEAPPWPIGEIKWLRRLY